MEIFFFVISVLIIILWKTIITIFGKMAGFEKQVYVPISGYIKETGWGTAGINGVNMNGSIKLVEYDCGWLIKTKRRYGKCGIWLAKDKTKVGPLIKKGPFTLNMRTITCGHHTIVLKGKLAQKVGVE